MAQHKLRFFIFTLFFTFMGIGSLFSQTDNRLNGRWEATLEDLKLEYKLNNGNLVSSTTTFPYSVDANTLILTDTDSGAIIFYKK